MSVNSFSVAQSDQSTLRVSTQNDNGNPVQIERYNPDTGQFDIIANTNAGEGSYDDSGRSQGVTYSYRGTDDGGSSYSAEVQGSLLPIPDPPVVSPSINTPSSCSVYIGVPTEGTMIVVRASGFDGEPGVTLYSGPASAMTLYDTTAKIGRMYTYQAVRTNLSGSSGTGYGYGCRPLLAANSPDPADVRNGEPCIAADLLSATTGTLEATAGEEYVLKTDVVAAANVLLDVPRWAGATGADKGTVRLPGEARVEDEYDYGPSDSMQGTLVPAPGPAPDDAWAIDKKAIWTEQLKSMPLMVYQHARFRFLFTLVDGEDAPINVDGKLCSFVVFNAAGATLYQIDGLPVTANTIYVSGADTRTATAATNNWVLRNDTDDVVLARGTIVVQAAADRTP